MKPTANPTFNMLYKNAEHYVKEHKVCKDMGSMKLAAFACGRLVGYHMAVTKDDLAAQVAMDVLEGDAIKAGVR